ncbi:MAG TPA: GDYXXLXY domain-containing protein [Adhaeribacter sp.]|nr:GDYXXLXY domain-containing protein [Adhaeribacter sp.]
MKKKTWLLIAFLLVALAQLYVPAQMIWSRETILAEGEEFKFRTAPIDPNDPFRGKYITLRFKEEEIEVENADDWQHNQEIYVRLQIDKQGFARPESISKDKPTTPEFPFVKATVRYVNTLNGKATMSINYPFDRFYMEESKAPEAEETYVESQLDSTQIAYALVRIKNGDAVLKDVFIDSVSITELVKARRKK